MAQLKMYWKNDGGENPEVSLPAGVTVKSFPEIEDALTVWQNVIKYMSKNYDVDTTGDYYARSMLQKAHYREDMCYIFMVEGAPAATITVVCDEAAREGCIHMVACKPEFRGRGLGHLMLRKAVNVLKQKGMATAYLVTDDWRVPAIKAYLKAGFTPDLDSESDYKERWQKIFAEINP